MYVTKHGGFAMILAIFIVVLVSMGGVLLLGKTVLSDRMIGDKYVHTQAEMLAMSATEFAVMRAQDFNTSGANCLNQVNVTVNDSSGAAAYDVNVTIRYSFKGIRPVNNQCNTLTDNTGNPTMMLIDTVVKTNDDANLSLQPIRVYKRSWQVL
ncbi:MAG: hypothetical protein PHW18_01745 [Sulfuricurvum sp.]|uniref:hypothetical protein n=1 Tax=Sulfuricurvum sp. TaxID=2025608 RepID=UPI00261FB2BC|nr:hypothetical protein [Sulfuricurvum sp.]MDD2828278.1 hypothetical protein [Sulfuricurvum sp.]MDD4949767.1 hypothetical protein [Sulfuricurvum sp.]